MRTCEVCPERYYGRGYCKRHYMSFWRYGDPLAPGSGRAKTGTWRDKYEVDSETGCWVWQAALTSGYGAVRYAGSTRLAHRVAYEEIAGPIPDDCHLHHECGNPRCVNPDHLAPMTAHDHAELHLARRWAT